MDREEAHQPKKIKFSDSEPSTSQKFILRTLPKAVVKREHNAPLPSPFPLPKNFRPDVQAALESQKMTLETTRSFLSTVASAIATFTLYPTRDDLSDVARTIVAQYPFMQASKGKPYMSIHANKTSYIMYTSFVGCTCRRIKKLDERAT